MEGVTATKRRREPSRKLKSAENAAEAATSHQKAARAAHLRTQGHGKTTELIAPASISTAHHSASPPTHEYDNEEATEHEPLSKKVKRRRTEPKFPEQEKLSTPVHVSSDSENDQDEIPLTRQDSRQDIRPFFKNLRNEGKSTKTDCTLCGTTLVNDVTTLRRHMQSTHLSKYYAWIKKIGVESKLPHDRKKVAMEKAQQADQTTLDVHLQGKMSKDCVVKYSDANFNSYFFLLNNIQLNIHQYPTWASLARDHLAIMASSVSSERAFSSAGITISKRRNRLQEDIVEALQCLKGAIQKNIIFRDEEVILTEQELEDLEYDDTNVEIHHPEMIEVDDEQ